MFLSKFSRWILYKRLGWTKNVTEVHPDKYIICLAPHTSNWDFVVGQLYQRAENLNANFLMKKEWFFWPLGYFARRIGGIPVYRSKNMHLTEQLTKEVQKRDKVCLTITPEGTRSLNPQWKKGFYYISLNAGIPIMLYAIDYERKLIECTKTVVPTGDIDKDMREIMLYYKDYKGHHPEKFTIGDIV